MPKVVAQGQQFECPTGANLRQVLLAHRVDLYNGKAAWINCRGIGTCGTCAIGVAGDVSEANWRDRTRRALPPHSLTPDRRLACQTRVFGDVQVTKFSGFWGEGAEAVWTPEGLAIAEDKNPQSDRGENA